MAAGGARRSVRVGRHVLCKATSRRFVAQLAVLYDSSVVVSGGQCRMGVEAQARRLVEEIRQASWPETLMKEDQLRNNDDIVTAIKRVGGEKDGGEKAK
jgi:hypothetical protein